MFEQRQVSRQEAMLIVVGSLSAEASMEFQTHLEVLAGGDSVVITLDFSRTDSICSSALGKILLYKQRLAEKRRTLQIRGCSNSLFSIFQMINFDSLVSIERFPGEIGNQS